jgi:hypothetical protein
MLRRAVACCPRNCAVASSSRHSASAWARVGERARFLRARFLNEQAVALVGQPRRRIGAFASRARFQPPLLPRVAPLLVPLLPLVEVGHPSLQVAEPLVVLAGIEDDELDVAGADHACRQRLLQILGGRRRGHAKPAAQTHV